MKWNTIAFKTDFTNLDEKYTITPAINFIKNSEQFIPIIPQNLKYSITNLNGSIVSKQSYNLELDEQFGVVINNNIIGIGTYFYIVHNITSLNNIFNVTLTEQSEFEDDNYQFVHIHKTNTGTNATSNLPLVGLKTYLDNNKDKTFHILNNKIYVDGVDTHIRIKNTTLIAYDKYSAYIYYE